MVEAAQTELVVVRIEVVRTEAARTVVERTEVVAQVLDSARILVEAALAASVAFV